MNICFASKKVEIVCNDSKKAVKKLGPDAAKGLHKRLAQLNAVVRLGDFKFDEPHPLKGDRLNEFAITAYAGLRVVLKPDDDPTPKTKDDVIDWDNVTKIKITSVEDYH